ncbi:MAG: response regulator [Clostridia bacterium]|nr:response regulator [Clostridia bacterium]
MKQSKIKVLIVDDNSEVCDILSNFLKKFADINVCDTANDGASAVDKIFYLCPDIVILDIIMPVADGIYVLQKTQQDYRKPIHFIVLSAISNDLIINRVLNLGATYYMVKPAKKQSLLDWIRFLYENGSDENFLFEKENTVLDSIIKKKLMELGIPLNQLGYQYIIEALKFMVTAQSHFLTSEIYEIVAQKKDTSVNCVESAIRNTTIHAHKKCNDSYKELFTKNNEIIKPTNSQFLSTLSESIKLNLSKLK